MTPESLLLLIFAVAMVALLYSCVGHAGASGYIAAMVLAGVSTTVIRPTALVLNIFVACIGAFQFWRAGHFSWRLFWPFAALSVPLAFWGGRISLPTHWLKVLLGLTLLYSAIRFFIQPKEENEIHEPSVPAALCVGAVLGLLSGLTGTGGGIFLTPLMIFLRWGTTKAVAAVSAMFILLNSISGLLGVVSNGQALPPLAWKLLPAAIFGGAIGSYLGSNCFSPVFIKRVLSAVLIVAAYKLILQ
ncbi:MAG TPA: sulfite exporter TauE/SafE family protein [Blastocatellia bacterium]|nr:sulfite exporter TauE/SafE family protein [Blastocatellia bacterium]HMX30098.1 sulfite exporter TauE/SafE family protein [Blastocatellia bacterium]HMY71528.1 sulfite exporter TauE/SafE family protein [Blastocatellia bacterium]HMZ16439.1 sulfite exporter TauE/SafE family protein [Blastocatellia bacterium]HNG30566.1 sulfite exporter TauE/SafE family protein [Blastocatellia bacterium]